MFYSPILLGRKGPYGTVWCAAHMQNRLKTYQYTTTNITKTVDHIIDPEATPISLRLSSALLLGVVRIYSKKIDFLFRDYNLLNTLLIKAFVSTQVDLPENARIAPIESVTLPQSLNLDYFHLEDDDILERYTYPIFSLFLLEYDDILERGFDNHLANEEDITLTNQIPTGIDPYVAITFEEDIIPESCPMDIDQDTVPVNETDVEMAYEAGPNNVALDTGTYGRCNDTEEIFGFFQDHRPSNLTETFNANSPGSVPEIEKRRDATHDLSPMSHPPFATQQQNVRIKRAKSLDETINEKEHTIPTIDEEEMLNSTRHSTLSPAFAGSDEERANYVHHPSPQLVLQPTPSSLPPQARTRKRKHFDKVVVLSNRIMKQRLEDPSDTLRKRNKMASSKLDIWRLMNNHQSKREQIFNEPLFTGFSDVLRSVFEKDCVTSKPYLAVSDASSPTPEAETEVNQASPIPQSTVPDSTNLDTTFQPTEDVQDFAVPQSAQTEAQSPQRFQNDDIGIERLRDDGDFSNYMMSSPSRTNDFTTQPQTYRTPLSTSSTNPENLTGLRNLRLSDIPEMTLEVGSNTPVRSPASQDFSNALTGRTRDLAQYLKERSSSSSPNSSSYLSLSKFLEGKTRNIAAQMFYETMVLKSRGLIDVQQDQPYSDISLKSLPALFSKVQL